MIVDEKNYLAHYGILRKSGRYPWGSGGTQSARNKSFLDTVANLRKEGMNETEIARGFGITTTELRAAKSIARNEQAEAKRVMAQRLQDKGYSNIGIGKRMGINESSVRSLLAQGQKDKVDILKATSDMLRSRVDKDGFIDVGSGVENDLQITRTKLDTAIAVLKEEGYVIHPVQVPTGKNQQTTIKVLAPPGTTYLDVKRNLPNIKAVNMSSHDSGRTFLGIHPPLNISSKRIAIKYKEDGGAIEDGVIHVRPGVPDVSLGASRYAQVRIAVDGTHFIKGMAIYKNDLPPGIDLVFNTNKSNTGNKLDALKEMKTDPATGKVDMDNPFGAVIKAKGQQVIKHANGKEEVVSVMNKLNEEGDWEKWSQSVSRQVLSKQTPELAKAQLNMTYERKKSELDTILKLTNPAVRKKLLENFADDADSSAVHMAAARFPRQASHVILPVPTLKPDEIYAPNYHNGERVVLIRFPHAGTFEIPELTVNNRHPDSKKIVGDAKDAIGIHPNVAARLSGADFDGDTVLVIPNNRGDIKTKPALEGLKGFDPQSAYPKYEGMKVISGNNKQTEMGKITNLIADMTIKGASSNELAAAVRHSMVIIDAEKHELNYKQSYIDNGIAHLKERYQGRNATGGLAGSATLITRAKSPVPIPNRTPRRAADGGPIDKATGQKVFTPTGESFVNAKGKTIIKTFQSQKLAEVTDAHVLSSGTRIESIYADHSNKLKALANQARKEAVHTTTIPYSPSAKTAYANEVSSLNAKLNIALRNRPLERQARILANTVVSQRRAANPDMSNADIKKIEGQALTEARLRTGAKKIKVEITDNEWKAIQAGAISNNKLKDILNNTDIEHVKKLATPHDVHKMTKAMTTRARQMIDNGYTQAEVASQLGVSTSTISTALSHSDEEVNDDRVHVDNSRQSIRSIHTVR